MKRLDELDSPLNTASELENFCKKLRDLERDFYMELAFAAEQLQQNLATLPVAGSSGGMFGAANSRVRAKMVADSLRRAAEAHKYSGGQAVKVWRQFVKVYAPEIDAARNKNSKRPTFKVNE